MDLNSWDYHDLDKEMRGANVFELMELFKRERGKYTDKCSELVSNMKNLNEVGRQSIEDECRFLEGAKLKVALRIAETLTK